MSSNPWFRNGFIYLIILVALGALFINFFQQPRQPTPIPISKLAQSVTVGTVKRISANGTLLTITYKDTPTTEVTSKATRDATVEETLRNLGVPSEKIAQVEIVYEQPAQWGDLLTLITGFLPLVLVAVFFIIIMRQAQSGNNQALSFGKSRARMFSADKPTVTFTDVAGVDEAKQELKEVVEFLKEPEKFTALGARIPKGVLLVGPPGTGKTLLARAVAGEANVPFFSISGSEFVEMFVGVGASRVRDLFEQAKRHAPCIVFVDEIDAVGRHRGAGLGGSHDEREQTLNQILVEMDGFDTDTNVIIVAATNRPDILDPALLRPGRFDRRVVLDRPDMNGRKQIIEVHIKGKPMSENIDLLSLARQTPGFSGADIENLVNEAAILAARRNKKSIEMTDVVESIEKVIAGPERRSRIINDDEKRIIAYHEAGHAIVSHLLPNCDPVVKVSIISRGMALGYTMNRPEDDRYLQKKSKFMDDLAALLGGRAAEDIVFSDIRPAQQTTSSARPTWLRDGGALWNERQAWAATFGDREELVFLGREISEQRNYSEQVASKLTTRSSASSV
jgi:cell division protease FtsH